MKCQKCSRDHHEKGLCIYHHSIEHNRFCACGEPSYKLDTYECKGCYENRLKRNRGRCRKPNCFDLVAAKRLCGRHYAQQKNDVRPDYRKRNNLQIPIGECVVSDCDSTPVGRSLCQPHLDMWTENARKNDLRLDQRLDEYEVSESLRVLIFETVAQANRMNGIDFNTWSEIVYGDREQHASSKQWTRVRDRMRELGIPFIESRDQNDRIVIRFSIFEHELEEFFRGNR